MKLGFTLGLVLACVAPLAWAGPKGTAPRASADAYAAHAEIDGTAVGARLLTPEQARKIFVSDVNRCCLVIEVAFYPAKDKPLDVSLNNLVLHVSSEEAATKPMSASVVAAKLQKAAAGQRDVTVSPTVGVGYESGGFDPVTGINRGHGVYTQAGVGVGVGGGGPQPGSTDKDRSAMQTELGEKGLPEGSTSTAVAGYVYFPISSKAKKNATRELEYQLNGGKVVLALH